WLGNVLVREGVEALEGRSEELLRTVEGLRKNLIIVTNEVGMGIVPPAFETRRYAEVLGTLNGELARRAGEVYLVVSGIPLMLKGGEK
ncbi:MAG: bifunctional adenosylcobinamide kinase/adenosylcobinamide-phosphate guanylyltransferase, partial [Deltaproteobacteria bacterium]